MTLLLVALICFSSGVDISHSMSMHGGLPWLALSLSFRPDIPLIPSVSVFVRVFFVGSKSLL